jgi:NADH:ubiquinone oxidoreductase subunit F (NADH-binding)
LPLQGGVSFSSVGSTPRCTLCMAGSAKMYQLLEKIRESLKIYLKNRKN